MAVSIITYTADGSTNQFSITFDYISQSHVVVKVNGATAPFTFLNASTIQTNTTPTAGQKVEIRRVTPVAALVDFTDGSTLFEADLDLADKQARYVAEEAKDISDDAKTTVETNITSINTVADLASEITTINSNISVIQTASTAATNAAASATAAATSATNAATSATAATAEKTAAETAKTAAETAKQLAETAKNSAFDASSFANTYKNNAATSATDAETSATDAETSATSAAASASSASNSASTATLQANTATTQAGNAASSATTASTQASAATTQANAAASSASTATTKATEAATSATNALNSETSAGSSATAANTSKLAAQAAQTAAETAETNAETAETNAAASETAASASATSASGSASTATTKASEASTSASTAATKASEAATSATNASNSATAAQTAKTAAETAKTGAEAAQTGVQTAETNASNSATAAASSASTASTQASTATTQATNAASSATAAANSASSASSSATASQSARTAAETAQTAAELAETNAETAETNAETAETNAASSATAAATSATSASNSASTATTQASTATTQASTATTKASEASTSAGNAATSATNAAASATAAASSASTATNQASTATTQASNATTQANTATTKASQASSSASSALSAQTAAESARDSALAAFDNFDDKYLGSKSSAPTADNDGNSLVAGALYFDTTAGAMQVYSGSAWLAAYASLSGALLETNNLSDVNNAANAATNIGLGTGNSPTFAGLTLNGNLTVTGTGTVDGRDIAADGTKLDAIEANATADQTASEIRTLVESASNSNVFTDADHSKLNGIAASANNYSHPNHSGDVISSGDGATTIANDAVTYAKIQNVTSNNVLLGNDDGAGSAVQELTAANVRSILNVENGASADQTASEIRALVESASDSNVFTDADHSKLNAIEASADVTDAANVNPLVDAHINVSGASSGQYLNWNGSDYAWSSVDTSTLMPKAGGTFTGDVTFNEDLLVGQNDKLWLGYSSGNSNMGLQLFHGGTSATIENHNFVTTYKSDGHTFKRHSTDREYMTLNEDTNHTVSLKAAGSTRLQTSGTGVTVTGTVAATAVTGDGSGLTNLPAAPFPSSGGTFTDDVTFGSGPYYAKWDDSEYAFIVDKGAKIAWGDGGSSVYDQNFMIYASSLNHTYINNQVGSLYISNQGTGDVQIEAKGQFGSGKKYFLADSSSYEAQLFYDGSQKLATKSNGVEISGTLTAGTLASTGSMTMDVGGNLTIDVDGSNIFLADGGTQWGWLNKDLFGGFNIYVATQDKDFTIQGNDGGTIIEALRLDMSDNGSATFKNHLYAQGGKLGRDLNDYVEFTNNTQMDVYINGLNKFRFEADGDFHADGNVVAYSTTISDERLKEDIKPITGALDKVGQLSGYTFTYKNDGKESAGVIAQEVEKVLPSAVTETTLPLQTDDGVEYKTVQYDQLVGLLIESVKELKAEIEELKNGSAE